MDSFTYTRARDVSGAIDAADRGAAPRFLGGGTTLIDLMKLGVETPRELIDINHVALTAVEVTPTSVRVGANVRNSDLAEHPEIRRRYPVLSEALLSGASPQLRNMATVGGNLMQRTRCYYFRDTQSPCNKRQPGSGCAAIDGYNRIHAVLGTSEKCIATHPSDMSVALAALEGVVHVQGPAGPRAIPIDRFFIPYGQDPARETTLAHAELITAVELPADAFLARSCYVKVRDRASYEFALASAAVALDIDSGKIRAARIALGGVATKPWRSHEAEKALVGAAPGEAAFRAAAEAALLGAKPQKDNAFKIELAKRTLMRALATVAAMT